MLNEIIHTLDKAISYKNNFHIYLKEGTSDRYGDTIHKIELWYETRPSITEDSFEYKKGVLLSISASMSKDINKEQFFYRLHQQFLFELFMELLYGKVGEFLDIRGNEIVTLTNLLKNGK